MKAKSNSGYGSGWHFQSKRHSQARKTGRAGGEYVVGQTVYGKGLLSNPSTSRRLIYGRFLRKDNEGNVVVLDRNFKESSYDPKYVSAYSTSKLEQGAKVEAEHAQTIKKIRKNPHLTLPQAEELIAKDHLKEDPNYYAKLKQIEAKPKNYEYEVIGFDGKTKMNTTKMIAFAKLQLKYNKRQGMDKEVKISDMNKPINAWVYLRNIGLGTKTNREEW